MNLHCSPAAPRQSIVLSRSAAFLILLAYCVAPSYAATIEFTGAKGSAWNDRLNWLPKVVPGPSDTAVFNGDTVADVSTNVTVAGLVMQLGVGHTGSSTVQGAGQLTVTGAVTWSSGILSTHLIVPNGAALTVTAGAEFSVDGGIVDSAGLITVAPNGFIAARDFKGTGVLPRGTFNNTGTIDLQSTDSGSYLVLSNGTITPGRAIVVHNSGLVSKTTGSGAFAFHSTEFDNKGILECQVGTLEVVTNTTVSQSGTIRILTAGFIDFQSGAAMTLLDGNQVVGDGVLRVNFSNATFNGTLVIGGADGTPGHFEMPTSSSVAGTLFGNVTLVTRSGGTATWIGGSIAGTVTIPAGSRFIEAGGGHLGPGAVLNNAGTLTWTAKAELQATSGNVVNNSGLFDIQAPNGGEWLWVDSGDPALPLQFINSGVLKRSVGSATAVMTRTVFTNTGLIDVQTGSIDIGANSQAVLNGPVQLADGSNLTTDSSATVAFGTGNRISGPGRLKIGSFATGTVTATGTINVGIPGGVAGNLELGLQPVAGDFTLALTDASQVFWSGAILTGHVTLLANGHMICTGGSLSGTLTVQPGASLVVSGTTAFVNIDGSSGEGLLNNAGNLTVNQATITAPATSSTSKGTISNSGTIALNDGLVGFNGTTLLHNNGALVVARAMATGNGSELLNTAIDGSGSIEVRGGTLSLQGSSGTLAGPIRIAGGAAMEIRDGSYTVDPVTRITGDGIARIVPSGTCALNGTLNVGASGRRSGRLEMKSGTISGNLTLVTEGLGEIVWNGATLSGTVTVPIGSRMTVENLGSRLDGSAGAGVFINRGEVALLGTSGIVATGGNTSILNSGRFEIVTGDSSYLAFDTSGANSALAFNNLPGGVLRRSGGVGEPLFNNVSVANTGTLRIDRGSVRVNGPFSQSAGGRTVVTVDGLVPAVQYGVLNVAGPAALTGGLNLSFSGLHPSVGDSFRPINASSVNGTFNWVSGAGLSPNLVMQAAYSAASVTASVAGSPTSGRVGIENISVTHPSLTTARIDFDTVPATDGAVTFGPATATGEVPAGATTIPFAAASHSTVVLPNLQAGTAYAFNIAANAPAGLSASSLTQNFRAPIEIAGDLNNDGVFDIKDVQLAIGIWIGAVQPTPLMLDRGDVMPRHDVHVGDGVIRSDDINWLLRRLVGLG